METLVSALDVMLDTCARPEAASARLRRRSARKVARAREESSTGSDVAVNRVRATSAAARLHASIRVSIAQRTHLDEFVDRNASALSFGRGRR